MQTRYEIYRHWAVDKGYTIRNIIEKMTTGGGHWSPCGSAERIAEEMQERFVQHGCDGFNLSSTYQLGGSERITRASGTRLASRRIPTAPSMRA